MGVALPDHDTGEIIPTTDLGMEAEIQRLRDHVTELQRTLARQAFELGDLKRDKLHDAEAHRLWPLAVRWHHYHNKATGRRSRWKLDCFDRALPFLTSYGIEVCEAASDGIATDHFSRKRKNGTTVHYNTWGTLLKSTDSFEEAVNCAPLEVLAVLREEGLLPGMSKKKKGSAARQRSLASEAADNETRRTT